MSRKKYIWKGNYRYAKCFPVLVLEVGIISETIIWSKKADFLKCFWYRNVCFVETCEVKFGGPFTCKMFFSR